MDIFVTLPPLRECNMIQSLIARDPDLEDDVVTEMIQRYVLDSSQHHWILGEAPAGIANLIAKLLLDFGTVRDPSRLTELLNMSRFTTQVFDQFQGILGKEAGLSVKEIEEMDLLKILRTVTNIESYLITTGYLKDYFRIESKEEGEREEETPEEDFNKEIIDKMDDATREAYEQIQDTRRKVKEYKQKRKKNPKAIDFEKENFRFVAAGGKGVIKEVDPMTYNIYEDENYMTWEYDPNRFKGKEKAQELKKKR